MHPFGSDFYYEDARSWFINLDPIIKYINNHPDKYNNTQVLFSTPSIYLK